MRSRNVKNPFREESPEITTRKRAPLTRTAGILPAFFSRLAHDGVSFEGGAV
jgi:hypothetical protein